MTKAADTERFAEPEADARITIGYWPGGTPGDAEIVSVADVPVAGDGCAVTVSPDGRVPAVMSTGASRAVRAIARFAVAVAPGATLTATGLTEIFNDGSGVTVTVMLALASVVLPWARTISE
jgi:hypothetical protein